MQHTTPTVTSGLLVFQGEHAVVMKMQQGTECLGAVATLNYRWHIKATSDNVQAVQS